MLNMIQKKKLRELERLYKAELVQLQQSGVQTPPDLEHLLILMIRHLSDTVEAQIEEITNIVGEYPAVFASLGNFFNALSRDCIEVLVESGHRALADTVIADGAIELHQMILSHHVDENGDPIVFDGDEESEIATDATSTNAPTQDTDLKKEPKNLLTFKQRKSNGKPKKPR
jgi:hypothetical protein